MNVIDKISCYIERSVITLKLRKEYLNTVTHNTPVLLWIKNWTVLIERYSISTLQTVPRFFGPLCILLENVAIIAMYCHLRPPAAIAFPT